ncbi:hypothetical protein NARC_60166 [Candidatus Nitrosocosmicus arcticus]|uniref:Uncharacterized protein n=1 Tax=Candidatus Nitrosocosmicus arcticus TaxID=2035267 RepID=A0A557SVZ4_9ARCH|nr:hypothetical protein NARC_60166 [Candidatus Nitrosocosmicus arcticus]
MPVTLVKLMSVRDWLGVAYFFTQIHNRSGRSTCCPYLIPAYRNRNPGF